MRFALGAFALVLSSLPATGLLASDGFRCPGGRIVSRGDRMPEVVRKCGEPDASGQHIEKRKVEVKERERTGGGSAAVEEEHEIEIVVDEWMYDLGGPRFLRHLRFENGVLVGIQDGERAEKRP